MQPALALNSDWCRSLPGPLLRSNAAGRESRGLWATPTQLWLWLVQGGGGQPRGGTKWELMGRDFPSLEQWRVMVEPCVRPAASVSGECHARFMQGEPCVLGPGREQPAPQGSALWLVPGKAWTGVLELPPQPGPQPMHFLVSAPRNLQLAASRWSGKFAWVAVQRCLRKAGLASSRDQSRQQAFCGC